MSLPIPEVVPIPVGEFIIGAVPDDKFANTSEFPSHPVKMDTPFCLGRFPVRQDEWAAFASSHRSASSSSRPAVNVSWADANAYIAWLRYHTDDPNWRLPTEAEWEYACRAGQRTVFASGDNLSPDEANFHFDEAIQKVGPGSLTEVDAYPANAWGVHDLHGNIYEWTCSPWRPDYESDSEPHRFVVRGGSWDGLPRLLRCSAREGLPAGTRRDNLGFRIAYGGEP